MARSKQITNVGDNGGDDGGVLEPRKRVFIRKALEKIAKENGGKLTAELVFTAAKDPEHVLHNEINWDTKNAAYRYQLTQCRALILAAYIVKKSNDRALTAGATIRMRAFPSTGMREGFAPRQAVLSDEDGRRHLIRGKLAAIRSALVAVSDLPELDGFRTTVLQQIEDVAGQLSIVL